MLSLRQADDKTIQSVGQYDLTCEARVAPRLCHNVQHVFFGRGASSYAIGPNRINIDVASGTGTVAATIPVDAGYTVVGGCAHERSANGNLERMHTACDGNKSDLGHSRKPREKVQL